MGIRMKISKLASWLKRSIFLVSWMLSFLILIAVSKNNELNLPSTGLQIREHDFRPIKNQLGAVSYTHCDIKENYRPLYYLCFKNLRIENNKLGIFKTALHKLMKIQGLELCFYRYTSHKVNAATKLDRSKSAATTAVASSRPSEITGSDTASVSEDTTSDIRELIKKVIQKLINPMDGWRLNNIDFGNISEVHVYNFDYKMLYDDELFFAIQSKRAIVSYKHSGVVLRGHVTIKTADGSTLESNYVEWDIKKQQFSVNEIILYTT